MTRDPAWLTDGLDDLKRDHLLRPRRVVEPLGPGHSRVDGQQLVDFSSNDYLGLATHPEISALVLGASRDGADPLVTHFSAHSGTLPCPLYIVPGDWVPETVEDQF